MRLLNLTCNNKKFKPLIFNKGLNIITGIQLSKEEKDSFNGIGKSMSLNLIHYILGARIKNTNLKRYLGDYGIFTLKLEQNKRNYVIEKDFSINSWTVNNVTKKSDEYIKFLNNIFIASGEYNEISFRQLFNCFARRYEGTAKYYNDALVQQGVSDTEFRQKFVNFILLGIDIQLVKQCKELKEEIKVLDTSIKELERYEEGTNKGNVEDIKDEIERLCLDKDKFIIAKNYNELQNNANLLTENLDDLRNEIYSLNQKLKRKEKNISIIENIEIDSEDIERMYREAKIYFGEEIILKLEDAQNFHSTLLKNREERFKKEIFGLNQEIDLKKESLNKLGEKRDLLLKELESKGALEEYVAIADRIKELEDEVRELEKYKNLASNFKIEKQKLKGKEAINKKLSIEFLKTIENDILSKEKIFRTLVKRFYDNTGGVLKLTDTKSAKYLYNIDISIPKEGSQGVGGVKIFCYDILLFLLNSDILKFLAHDGFILSGMDPRQISTLFKIVLEIMEDNPFQYLINLNEDVYKNILNGNILNKEEKKVIQESVILELNDKNPENWLFGEAFN